MTQSDDEVIITSKQAGAGAVPSSGMVNSLVKIEFFFMIEIR